MKGGVPVCTFDDELGMFRVLHTKGKAISSFGVSWKIRSISDKDTKEDVNDNAHRNTNVSNSATTTAAEFLFMEEALFLHERGFLEVVRQTATVNLLDSATNDGNNEIRRNSDSKSRNKSSNEINNILSTQEMYDIMLEKLRMPLQVYLTYSYLRSQTYIVLRHTVDRLKIIEAMEGRGKDDNTCSGNSSNIENGIEIENDRSNKNILQGRKKRKRSHRDQLKMDLRHDTFHAPVPFVFGINDQGNINTDGDDSVNENSANIKSNRIYIDSKNDSDSGKIAFDVYKPNKEYRKSNPGRPDLYVAISNFAQPSPPFATIKGLIQACSGITLRMATVADGGTVIMFGLTDFGVPCLDKGQREQNADNKKSDARK